MSDALINLAQNISYALMSIAGAVTLGRLYIRWRYSSFYWDDLLNGLAFACLLTFVILPSAEADDDYYWRSILTYETLNWTTLWLAKASFLALCWMIFNVSPKFRRVWWVVTTYTILSYWPVVLNHIWECGRPVDYGNALVCLSFSATQAQSRTWLGLSIAEAFLHISSELSILGLSLAFIRNLQMTKAQKFNAAAIFGVVIITIITGLLSNTTSITTKWGVNAEPSATTFYITQAVEPHLATIVCALPPYKLLVAKYQQRKEDAANKRENDMMAATAAAQRPTRKPQRHFGIQDSITELEMA